MILTNSATSQHTFVIKQQTNCTQFTKGCISQ